MLASYRVPTSLSWNYTQACLFHDVAMQVTINSAEQHGDSFAKQHGLTSKPCMHESNKHAPRTKNEAETAS
jgi:hypothetical protein